jgi:hypothetical protein
MLLFLGSLMLQFSTSLFNMYHVYRLLRWSDVLHIPQRFFIILLFTQMTYPQSKQFTNESTSKHLILIATKYGPDDKYYVWPARKLGVKYVLCNSNVIQTFVFTSIRHDSDQAENLHNMLSCTGKILHKFYGSHGNNFMSGLAICKKSHAVFSVSAITVISTSVDNWGSRICNFQILNILINAFSWLILHV